MLDNERNYTTILSIKVGSESQAAILKEVQRHPAKHKLQHLELQRVLHNENVRMTITLHFKGDTS